MSVGLRNIARACALAFAFAFEVGIVGLWRIVVGFGLGGKWLSMLGGHCDKRRWYGSLACVIEVDEDECEDRGSGS